MAMKNPQRYQTNARVPLGERARALGRPAHLSAHPGRRPDEPVDGGLRAFYERLLAVLRRPEVRPP
jgi:hypothetical protein